MQVEFHSSQDALGIAAARQGAVGIAAALQAHGRASIIVATGASQFAMLDHLVAHDIDWKRVTAFHLDEYVGLSASHPASFRRYLKERFVDRLPALGEFVMVNGDAPDIDHEIARLNARIGDETIDVCFAGIGENCHLAFNDPPADFETEQPYIVVDLDEACRRQQMGEGWFGDLDSVPRRAISMGIRQIMESRQIVLSVPDQRKAEAVRNALKQPVSAMFPASILQRHPAATLHLDPASASLLA